MTRDEHLALDAKPYGPEALVALDCLQAEAPSSRAAAAQALCRWIDERRYSIGVRRTYKNEVAGRVLGDWERIRKASRVRLNADETRDTYLVLAQAAWRLRCGRSWRGQDARGLLAIRRLLCRCHDGLVGDDLEQVAWVNVESVEDGCHALLRGYPYRREDAEGHRLIHRRTLRRLCRERRKKAELEGKLLDQGLDLKKLEKGAA